MTSPSRRQESFQPGFLIFLSSLAVVSKEETGRSARSPFHAFSRDGKELDTVGFLKQGKPYWTSVPSWSSPCCVRSTARLIPAMLRVSLVHNTSRTCLGHFFSSSTLSGSVSSFHRFSVWIPCLIFLLAFGSDSFWSRVAAFCFCLCASCCTQTVLATRHAT